MAYLPPDDELRKQQAAMGTSPSADASGGGTSAGSAPPPAQSNPSSFVNLSDYLAPNQGAAQQMGQGLANQLGSAAAAASKPISDYSTAYGGWQAGNQQAQADWQKQADKITSDTRAEDDQKRAVYLDYMTKLAQDPRSNLGVQKGVAKNYFDLLAANFPGYRTPVLPDAPTPGAAPDSSAAENAAKQASGLFSMSQDQGGRAALLGAGAGSQYTEGQRGLDSFLTGAEGMAPVNQTISQWSPTFQAGPQAWQGPGVAAYLADARKKNGGYGS